MIEARFRITRGTFILDVDLQMPSQGITALYGPSGSGKTTLLRAMAGLDRLTDGYLKVGEALWQNAHYFLPPHLRDVGYVFQETTLFPHLTVRKNLEYGFKRVPVNERRISFDQAVDLFDLEALLHRSPRHLSGGERQRVAIARAVLTSPRLLLMDEPLAALDLKRKREIFPFFEQMNETLEIPVLYVSHDPNEVARLADYMILLNAGRLQASGEIRDMLTRIDLPLAHDHDAGTIIEARVSAYDPRYHLAELEFIGGIFTVARQALPLGKKVRVRVLARDVSLTLERQSDTSILNIFPAIVEARSDAEHGQTMVHLNAGGASLLARLTQKSVEALGLSPGKKVYAQIKSVALLE